MALDPHPDREPGMEARVVDPDGDDWAKATKDGRWYILGHCCQDGDGRTWPELAARYPDATVVLP